MTQKVSKSSINLSHFKLRRLVLALVFLFAAHGVWGQTTYTWTGLALDGKWSSTDNWDDGSGNPVTTAPNSSSDEVIIPNSSTVTLDTNVTIDEITLGSGSTLTINSGIIVFANTITGDADSVLNKGHLITPNAPGNVIDSASTGVTTVAAVSDFVWTGASGSNNYWATGGNWFGGVAPSSSEDRKSVV